MPIEMIKHEICVKLAVLHLKRKQRVSSIEEAN